MNAAAKRAARVEAASALVSTEAQHRAAFAYFGGGLGAMVNSIAYPKHTSLKDEQIVVLFEDACKFGADRK